MNKKIKTVKKLNHEFDNIVERVKKLEDKSYGENNDTSANIEEVLKKFGERNKEI